MSVDDDWGDESPPMTREEKMASDAELPVHFITKEGQFLSWPDGAVTQIGPDHPMYNHEAGI